MATGEGRVVGVGRNVVAQKKNGEIVPMHLSLTEQQIGPDRRYFTGIMRDVEEELEMKKTVLQQEREVLDTLAVPAMILDERSTISSVPLLLSLENALNGPALFVCDGVTRQDTRVQRGVQGRVRLQPD
jgi:hypothetical protein